MPIWGCNSRSLYVGISMLRTGGGGRGGGVGTGLGAAFEHFLCPVRIFYHIWTLFQAQGSEMWPKKMPKKKNIYIYIYIYISNAVPTLYAHTFHPPYLHIDTCIYAVHCTYPLLPTPLTSTHQNHPTPPHIEIDQVPKRFKKIRSKNTVLD